MGVESAELVKHGVNAFLALSVAFANELAGIAERVGADASEVERGLEDRAPDRSARVPQGRALPSQEGRSRATSTT